MGKTLFVALTILAAVAAAAIAGPAAADRGPQVLRNGTCSNGTAWKLKAKLDNGRIEAEFEVDQNRVGRRWRVTLVQNGRMVFRGTRRTLAPSGSFSVERMLANSSGSDRIRASARALAGGETCSASLTF